MPTRWCTVAPLQYTRRLDVPYDLGNGVVLSLTPDWLKEEEILRGLALDDRQNLTLQPYTLMKEYDADSLGDPDPERRGKTPRSKQDTAREMIQLADLALWLAKPSSIGFSRLIVAERLTGTWSRVEFGRDDPLLPNSRDLANAIQRDDLGLAKQLHLALCVVSRDSVIWIAARTLWAALKQEEWTVRYPLVWIVLEALFGPTDAKEITYRLSQRLAFFLSADRREAQTLFKAAKAGYGWRSRVVHGMRLGNLSPAKAEELLCDAESFAKQSLNRILKDPVWRQKFSGVQREQSLDELVFSA